MSPFFSVIIPTFNQDNFLKQALNCLRNQTFNDFETIIIDNHSNDKTQSICESFELRKIYKKIQNEGIIAKSRNLGIKVSRGKWLAFLDTDDLWTNNKLEKVHAEIKNKTFDVFCNSEWIINEDSNLKKIWNYGFYSNTKFYEKMLVYGNCLSTSASVVRKEFLTKEKILFNEEKKFVTSEDYEFFLNIALNKGKFFFLKEPLGYHLIHSKSASAARDKHENSIVEVSKFHVFEKQKFFPNKEALWKNINIIGSLKKKIFEVKEKNNFKISLFFENLKLFLFNPLKSLKIIFMLGRKFFIQKICYYLYK